VLGLTLHKLLQFEEEYIFEEETFWRHKLRGGNNSRLRPKDVVREYMCWFHMAEYEIEWPAFPTALMKLRVP